MDVLVVDNYELVRSTLSRLLTIRHVKHEVASDGIEALRLCREHRFQLVISDLDMPKMNGVQLALELKRLYPAMRRFAFSGSSGDSLWEEASLVFEHVFDKRDGAAVIVQKTVEILGRPSASEDRMAHVSHRT